MPAADLYSLGYIYFAATGRGRSTGTWTSGTCGIVVAEGARPAFHRHSEPEPIRSRNPNVPEGLANLIHRLMAKKPKHRPESAALVRQELAPFSEPGSAAAASSVSVELVDPFCSSTTKQFRTLWKEIFPTRSRPSRRQLPVGDGLPVADGPPPDAEPPDAEFSLVSPMSRRSGRSRRSTDSVQLAIWSVLGIVGLAIIGVLIFVLVGRK